MTKSEYMEQLEAALSEFDAVSRAEIVAECVRTFSEGALGGLSDDEIIAELGTVDECVEAMRDLTSRPAAPQGDGTEFKICHTGEYPMQCVLNVKLCADVRVIASDISEPSINVEGPQRFIDNVAIDAIGDTITIYEREHLTSRFHLFSVNKTCRVNIAVPLRMKSISVDLDAGDFTSQNVQTDSLTVLTRGGDTHTYGLVADEFTCRSGGGDHKLESIAVNRLSLKTGGGDLSLCDVNASVISAETGGGEISFCGVNTACGEMKTGGGDIAAKDFCAHTSKLYTGGGDISLDCGDADAMQLTTGGGDVSVRAGVVAGLSVKTGGGDICAALADSASISLTTGSGDVDLSLSACCGAVISRLTGGGESTVCSAGRLSTYSGRFDATVGDGKTEISVKAGSGDLKITL